MPSPAMRRAMMNMITIMATIIITIMAGTSTRITAMTTATRMTIMCMTSTAATAIIITAMPMLMTASERPHVSAAMTELDHPALYRLMTWLSPAFPVGGFAYSSGIEWAVEAGDVDDAASLRGWLSTMLTDGSGFCDAVFLVHAHRAMELGDIDRLREVAELAAAFVPSRERQLETTAQGRAFIEIARSAWNSPGLDDAVSQCEAMVYPVAVGVVGAAHGIPSSLLLHAYLHAVTSNWISAGSRLIPLGQTDSQRVLAALEPVVTATAVRAISASLDDIGSATFRADLASLRHETQYTRLFRS